MSHANHPPRTGFLRTLVIGTLFGAFVGIAELWIGIFGSWAEGREGVVLLSCTASGATLGLVATCLNWLTGRVALLKSDFTFALVAVIAGASAGLVRGHRGNLDVHCAEVQRKRRWIGRRSERRAVRRQSCR